MASKPILFNTEMVRAILDDRKTQTRRLIKDKDITNNFDIDVDGSVYAYIDQATGDSYPPTAIAKYQIGDILWVRETWSRIDDLPYDNYVYRTDYGTTEDDSFPPSMFKWKPSIHMPREAARIFLRVTNVRVERLQEITTEGIEQEGFYCDSNYTKDHFAYAPGMRIHFSRVWDEIYSGKGYGWDVNPWVFVYEFERVSEDGSKASHHDR